MNGQERDYTHSHGATHPHRDDFHRHMHNGYEFLYFVSGDAEYVIGANTYRLHPHDLLFIRPGLFHCLKPVSDALYERFVIHFPQTMIPPSCLDFVKRAKDIYRIPRDSHVFRFYERWANLEAEMTPPDMNLLLERAATEVMLYLSHMREESSARPIKKNGTLEQILSYIDAHLTEEITVAHLSAHFYVSASYIVHTFHRTLNISLMQYVAKKRVLLAESMIKAGLPPTEVSHKVGYDSYTTFYRQYKKLIGHSPRATARTE